jgi:hypothetical protein
MELELCIAFIIQHPHRGKYYLNRTCNALKHGVSDILIMPLFICLSEIGGEWGESKISKKETKIRGKKARKRAGRK